MYLRSTCLTALLVLAPVLAATATAATFVVTTTADGSDTNAGDGVCATSGGPCSLRAAIQEANALPGLDNIHFGIGSGPQTIAVGSSLPTVSDSVVIDGTTQPGYSGTPLVAISGGGSRNGMVVTAGGTTLRGLAIIRFAGDGLTLSGGGGNVLEGNYVGMALDGVTGAPNTGSGVALQNSSDNRIGGPNASQRNVISNNTGKGNDGGIAVNGGSNNVIQGNFIGTDASGMLERANEGRGIAFSNSSNNKVGGPEPGAGNLIAGNRASGVRFIGGSNNLVQGNLLGVNLAIQAFLANDRGVQIRGSNGNLVIGNLIAGHVYDGVLIWQGSSNNLVYGNLIAYNGQGPVGDPTEAAFNGVIITGGVGNFILSNSIHSNAILGIQFTGPFGVTPNDAGDGDVGANNLQNYPVITSARRTGATTTIEGTLNSTADSGFLLQFFSDSACDTSGHGEGRNLLGQTVVNTNASGNASFAVALPVQVAAGWIVSATASGASGTSEFSACRTVQ